MCAKINPVARFLFVVVPIVARVWPPVAISDALTAMGHDVAWCAPEGVVGPVVSKDVRIYPTGKRSYRDFHELGLGAVHELWDQYVLPLNRFIQAPVDDAIADFQPDVVFADQYAFAGALAAHKKGLRWATLCAGALELTPPARLPGVQEVTQSKLARVREKAGLSNDDGVNLLFSPYLTIATTSRALIGNAPTPPNCVLVGATLGARRTDPEFDWSWWRPDRRHVLVTAGTVFAHMAQDFANRIVAALQPLSSEVHAVINFAESYIPDPPPNVLVAPRLPMLELMPRLDALVCQAGQSTVNEGLLHGVPMVVAPTRLGELATADQVTQSGAGIEVSYADATPAELRAAITAVLDEPSYRERARQIGDVYASEGGTAAAAAQLVALAQR